MARALPSHGRGHWFESSIAHQTTKVLIIGPLPSAASDVDIIGGAKVSFKETVSQLRLQGFELEIINSSRPYQRLSFWKAHGHSLVAFVRITWGTFKKGKQSQLVLLSMTTFTVGMVAPFVWIICKLINRPMALRLFGGNFDQVYEGYGSVLRWVADRTFMRCSVVFVETQRLLHYFENRINFKWLPNTRDISFSQSARHNKIRKLIFLGQLVMTKGLAEALTACRSLPEGCHLHVFGPQHDSTNFSSLEGHPRATYEGVIEPAEVPRVLAEHDLLILPSYLIGEGYSGVIIEAFQCGIPVISTWWEGIPEVVKHEENGLLVEPGSSSDLEAAIHRLLNDTDLYQRLCRGASCRGEFFRSSVWYDKFASDLRSATCAS